MLPDGRGRARLHPTAAGGSGPCLPRCRMRAEPALELFPATESFLIKHNHPQKVQVKWMRSELLWLKEEDAASWGD